MPSELLHIYGPISIHSYGLFIVIGIFTFIEFVKRDPRFASLNIGDKFINIVLVGAAIGLLGGRILFLLTEENNWCFTDLCSFWSGGFSILGGIISLVTIFPLYIYYQGIPVLRFTDLIATYAAIMLSISRIGCYFAGCCYGIATACAWGVTYTDLGSSAPLNIQMHPAL